MLTEQAEILQGFTKLHHNVVKRSTTSGMGGWVQKTEIRGDVVYGWSQRIYAKYPQTWLNFGNDENGTGYKSSWILRDLHKDTYLMWKTDTWHHICFSYSKPTSNVTLIKVRIIIKTRINGHLRHPICLPFGYF